MGVEVRPFNDRCNIDCIYCYEKKIRNSNDLTGIYDLHKIKAKLHREQKPFTLFGGEPLLMPIDDLEELWRLGYEKTKHNSIQTNGTLINSKHIELFAKYNVCVGISIDGPEELNDARWCGNLVQTRIMTQKVEDSINLLRSRNIYVSIIITLHKKNAVGDNLVILINWVRVIYEKGVRSFRVHVLEVNDESVRKEIKLSDLENFQALLAFAELKKELPGIQFDITDEIEMLLMGDDSKSSCVWHACDSYFTPAVTGINGNGQYSNCGRANKDGVDVVKSDYAGKQREILLYFTPQQYGGCRECNYFLMCKGQCHGTAIDGDWRNRTEDCGLYKLLFSKFESDLIIKGGVPLSLNQNLRNIEKKYVKKTINGQNVSLRKLDLKDIECSDELTWGDVPYFFRIAWSSDFARDVWNERITKITDVMPLVYAECIKRGYFSSITLVIKQWQIFQLHSFVKDSNLVIKKLESTKHSIAHNSTLLLLTSKKNEFLQDNNYSNFEMSNYDYFSNFFKTNSKFIEQEWFENLLLKDIGLYFLPDNQSKETIKCTIVSSKIIEVWAELNPIEFDWLKKLLSMPVKYSKYHGVLEVKTSIFKFIVKTEFTNEKCEVNYEGSYDIDEGSYGHNFPYKINFNS